MSHLLAATLLGLVALVRRLLRATLAVSARRHALVRHLDVHTTSAALSRRARRPLARLLTRLGRNAAERVLVRTNLRLSARHLALAELLGPTLTGSAIVLGLWHLS